MNKLHLKSAFFFVRSGANFAAAITQITRPKNLQILFSHFKGKAMRKSKTFVFHLYHIFFSLIENGS